jgi:hypothetical protein
LECVVINTTKPAIVMSEVKIMNQYLCFSQSDANATIMASTQADKATGTVLMEAWIEE